MESKYRPCRIPEIETPADVFDALLNIFRNRFGSTQLVPRAWLTDVEIFETIREAKAEYERRGHEKNHNHSDIAGTSDLHRDPDAEVFRSAGSIAGGSADQDRAG